MIVTKVGRRGQITVPREVRRRVDLKDGDRIAFLVEGGNLVVRPLKRTLLDLRGSVPVDGPQDFAEIRRNVLADRGRKETRGEA